MFLFQRPCLPKCVQTNTSAELEGPLSVIAWVQPFISQLRTLKPGAPDTRSINCQSQGDLGHGSSHYHTPLFKAAFLLFYKQLHKHSQSLFRKDSLCFTNHLPFSVYEANFTASLRRQGIEVTLEEDIKCNAVSINHFFSYVLRRVIVLIRAWNK